MTARTTRTRRRPRASHSMDAVISEAVALLDEGGDNALTFRALGGGATGIYWYVSNKDESRDKASDFVVGKVLEQTEEFIDGADPIDNLRAMAMVAFNTIAERPWLADYFMRNTPSASPTACSSTSASASRCSASASLPYRASTPWQPCSGSSSAAPPTSGITRRRRCSTER